MSRSLQVIHSAHGEVPVEREGKTKAAVLAVACHLLEGVSPWVGLKSAKEKSLKIKPRIQLGMMRFGFIFATGYEKKHTYCVCGTVITFSTFLLKFSIQSHCQPI